MKKALFPILICLSLASCKKDKATPAPDAGNNQHKAPANVMSFTSIFTYSQVYPVNYNAQWTGGGLTPNPQPRPVATMHKADLFYTCPLQQCTSTYVNYKLWFKVNNSSYLWGPYPVTLTTVPSYTWSPGSNLDCLEASFYFNPTNYNDAYTLYLVEPAFTTGNIADLNNYNYCSGGVTYNYRY